MLLALLLLAAGLRLWGVSSQSLWFDEILSALDLKHHYENFFVVQTDFSEIPLWSWDHPPLFFALTHYVVSVLDESEFSLRLVSVVAGVVSLGLFYVIGRDLLGPWEALIATGLLTVSAFHTRYCQEARPYSLAILFMLITLIFTYRLLRYDRMRDWLGWGVFTALSFYTHYLAVVTWVIQVLIIDIARKSRRQLLGVVLFSAAAWLAYIPWWPNFIKFLTTDLGQGAASHLELLAILRQMLIDTLGNGSAWFFCLGCLLALVSILFSESTRKRSVLLLGALWTVLQLGVFFIDPGSRLMSRRYILPILPFWCLALASGIVSLRRGAVVLSSFIKRMGIADYSDRAHRMALTTVHLSASFLVFISLLYSILSLRSYYHVIRENFKGVAEYLRDNILPGDTILVDYRLYGYPGVVEYYPSRFGFADQITRDWSTRAELESYCSFNQRAWYLLREISDSWRTDEIVSWVSSNWACHNSPELREFVLCGCGPSRSDLEHVIANRRGTALELATAYAALGQWDYAIDQYEEAAKRGDHADLAYRGLALVAQRIGRWPLAVSAYGKLLAQDPSNASWGQRLRNAINNQLSRNPELAMVWAETLPNLLEHGDLESGNSFYVPEPFASSSTAVYQVDKRVAHSGSASLMIEGKADGYHLGWGGQFAANANMPYLFGGMVRAEDYGGLKGRLMYWENNGSTVLGWQDFEGSIDDWTFYWNLVLLPPGEDMVNLDPMLIEGKGKIWVDDLILTRLDPELLLGAKAGPSARTQTDRLPALCRR